MEELFLMTLVSFEVIHFLHGIVYMQKYILPPFFSFDVLGLQLYSKIFHVLVYLIFFPKFTLVEKYTIKLVVTFGLSHVNLIINKDILVQNIQIFRYFNYSLRLVPRAKTSKDKKWREYVFVYLVSSIY